MREVLSVQFAAASDSFLVTIAAVKESEHVPGVMVRQLGTPEPSAAFAVDELPEEHKAAFRSLLEFLLGATEEKHAAMASDPSKLAAKASELAVRETRLRETEKANAELDIAIEAKRRALAELDTTIEAKKKNRNA